MNTPVNPAFLLIGSMKSGTTSVFEDMTRHSGIYCPTIKEPGDLSSDVVLTEHGLKSYLKIFSGADDHQWIGEASTQYTQAPEIRGVANRAKEVFGSELRLIFIGRDPIDRIKSHYRHEVQRGTITRPLEYALKDTPSLKSLSRYDFQLQEWLSIFPRENLLVLSMQDYIDSPKATIHRVWAFLGLPSEEMDHGVVSNVSSGKRAPRGLLRSLVRSRLYGLYVKKILSQKLRRSLRKLLVPRRALTFQDNLNSDTAAQLREELQTEFTRFEAMVDEDRMRFPVEQRKKSSGD